ncbi:MULTISPECIES: hypothetical protein [Bacillus]|uniref:DUF3089 domain-containing protein n=1 Tax=Bacillus cereus group sp. MS39 TaxID=3041344 RepID=A0AAU8F2Q8_9BACI|nr:MULTISPECIES: hypothetical protein [Bacillus]EOP04815.1 hypothetical protein ICS_05149 [Bacillus cereus BAG2O-3]EOQ17892.1 hypothetical protein KQ3_05519 [Bacillus cereus B5-2]EOQ34972.1 hypothetical protein KQ1_00313 [Bacillus cereus BAG3O-1]MBJ8117651.1 DUF3089 domain-containing protein [Bacillus cereus]PFW87027.1 DUF3089 domain-containing protein [Bacillus sp. AFS075960]RFB09809.1 DUF3089 domain-containing protein [Bacillus sp. OE]RFB21350.1 DUF3089 domain-containing protein [Bacillus 
MKRKQFVELQNELFRLFEQGDFDVIYRYIDKAKREFPERMDKTSFWEACVLSIEGKYEEAIVSLNEALEKGIWWNPHTLMQDEDLKELRENEAFKMIVKKCEEIFKKQQLTADPKLFTYGNEEAKTGLFSLHWRGSNINDFAPYWYGEEILREYMLGFSQSSQVHGMNSYSWDNHDIAIKDIMKSFNDFMGKYDLEDTILAGASQGGNIAIELALKNMLETQKFIAAIPAIRDVEAIESIVVSNDITNVEGYIVTGDKDPFYENTLQLMSMFEKYNVNCKLIVREGLGHLFPADFTQILKNIMAEWTVKNI